MALRRFWRLDGSSELVTPRVYRERLRRQKRRAERRGLEIVLNSRGRPKRLTTEQAQKARDKAEAARKRAAKGWAGEKGEKRRAATSARTTTQNRLRTAKKTGRPTLLGSFVADVGNMHDLADVIAGVYNRLPPKQPGWVRVRITAPKQAPALVQGRIKDRRGDRWRTIVLDEVLARLAGAVPVGHTLESVRRDALEQFEFEDDLPSGSDKYRRRGSAGVKPTRVRGMGAPPGLGNPVVRVEVEIWNREPSET